MLQADITNKALAALLDLGAKVPEDLEGLLFGRLHRPGPSQAGDADDAPSPDQSPPHVTVESCVATHWIQDPRKGNEKTPAGELTPIVKEAIKDQKDLRLLGWFRVRQGSAARPRGGPARLTMGMWRQQHIVSKQMTIDAQASSDKRHVPVIGCIVNKHKSVGEYLALAVDVTTVAGPENVPVKLKVLSLEAEATGVKPTEGASSLPLTLHLGNLAGSCEELEQSMRAPVELLQQLQKRLLHGGPDGGVQGVTPQSAALRERYHKAKKAAMEAEEAAFKAKVAEADVRRQEKLRRKEHRREVRQERQEAKARARARAQELQQKKVQEERRRRQEQTERDARERKTPRVKEEVLENDQYKACQQEAEQEAQRRRDQEESDRKMALELNERLNQDANDPIESPSPSTGGGRALKAFGVTPQSRQNIKIQTDRSRSRDSPASERCSAPRASSTAANAGRPKVQTTFQNLASGMALQKSFESNQTPRWVARSREIDQEIAARQVEAESPETVHRDLSAIAQQALTPADTGASAVAAVAAVVGNAYEGGREPAEGRSPSQ